MKYLILITGILLAGCTSQAQESPQLPRYVPNAEKFTEIKTELRDCMQASVDTPYYAMDRLRYDVQMCDRRAFHRLHFRTFPESYYTYWDRENGFDPFDDFSVCSSALANPMWDFSPVETTPSFRARIQACIDSFPKL